MQQPSDGAVGLVRARSDEVSKAPLAAPKGAIADTASGDMRVDLCVIGAGSGGLTVAAGAAQLGVSVALIERHKMGGDCLNYGCVPSKSLIAAGKRAKGLRDAAAFGIAPVEAVVDHKAVHHHIKSVIAAIAPNDSIE